MENYNVTTLPDEYEPLVPQSTGGFRVFVVFCCVAILCLSGYGLYNWLETGKFISSNAVEVREVERPGASSGITTSIFRAMTKDAVLVEIEIEVEGPLFDYSKGELQKIIMEMLYSDIPKNRSELQDWANYHNITSMILKSKTPLTKNPEIPGGSIREDVIK